MPGPGESRDDVTDIFSSVQARIIGLMGGGAAEMAIFGDSPPRFIESDVFAANALAGIICRTDASRSAFIEHCYQEALAIIEENKPVVLALAQALIDHPERTLNAAEIGAVISQTLAREALAAEHARRAVWRRTLESATSAPPPQLTR
jgi:ATP-dependent Zn protease